jgi:hypothetical protein
MNKEGVKKIMRFIMNYEGELTIKKNEIYEGDLKVATVSFKDYDINVHKKGGSNEKD